MANRMAGDVIDLLKNPELRTEVVKTIQEVYRYAGTLHDNPTEDMEEYLEKFGGSLWTEALCRAETLGEAHRIENAFRKYVFDKMNEPHRISPGEILNHFYSIARPGGCGCYELESIDFDALYEIFIHYIDLHVMSFRHSQPFPVCIVFEDDEEKIQLFIEGFKEGWSKAKGMWEEPSQEDYVASLIGPDGNDKDTDDEKTFWKKNGVILSSWDKLPIGTLRSVKDYRCYLLMTIAGKMSERACQQLRAEFRRILPSIVRSISLLEPGSQPSYIQEIDDELPFADEEVLLKNAKTLVRKCLDAYFLEASKKDSMDRRMRNAVHLLVESDNQHNHAISTALSVAAIEALLGEKGSELAEKLSTDVAVLLEPNLDKRYDAKQFIKEIYDLRSRSLHGETIEAEYHYRKKARHLAAAVLIGIISRRDFLIRSGFDPESPQDLLKDLRQSTWQSGTSTGVEEFNVRQLWIKD